MIEGNRRSSSQLFWFELRAGGRAMPVVVKVGARSRAPSPRPRIAPPLGARVKYREEHRAMSVIHTHFGDRDPERFSAIRVFDLLPRHHAFVMEAVDRPTLRHLALEPGRGTAVDLEAVFRNAGAWLHEYHAIRTLNAPDEVLVDREEFIDFVGEITDYLAGMLSEQEFFSRVRSHVETVAREYLPGRIPAGLTHNDYCMRNILVGPYQQVAVFDTLARYRAPIYRDLSFFLADLSYSLGPALVRGALHYPLRIEAYRSAFLEGYFGDSEVPICAVRVFEVQALLERWSSVLAGAACRNRTILRRVRTSLASRALRLLVKRRLDTRPRREDGLTGA